MKYREKIYLLIKIIFFFQHLKTSKHHLMTETPCTRNREMSIMDIQYMKVRKSPRVPEAICSYSRG